GWRKVRDEQKRNPELVKLESALVEALGFKMDTVPAQTLAYLRDKVLPELFKAGCRAVHVSSLINGMKDRK
ncbi:MAG TPA: hypothetical protein PLZ51_29110, partial [Aggregatilineales bacterium]|nr:hypothetical protein [Aggregatilineales bacterium]